jgi:5-methylcytosine-specific restriction endonuclease McrA
VSLPMEPTIDEQRRTYQNAKLLEAFWERGNRAKSRGGRLSLLREMARVELAADPYVPHSTQLGRRHFVKRKQKGTFRLNGWCWVCRGESPDHRHHIIPVAAGGRNRKLNIVNLCVRCHRDVHREP